MPWWVIRPIILGFIGCLGFSAIGFAIYLLLPVSTPQFLDPQGHKLPHSIAVVERWTINGIPQSLIIRGRDTSNPVLIWVHGGPDPARHLSYVTSTHRSKTILSWSIGTSATPGVLWTL